MTVMMLFIGPTVPRLRIAEGVVSWPDRVHRGEPPRAAGGWSVGFFGGADILQCYVQNVAVRREEILP